MKEDRRRRKLAFIKSCEDATKECPITALLNKYETQKVSFKAKNKVLFQRALDALGGESESHLTRHIPIPSPVKSSSENLITHRNMKSKHDIRAALEMLDSFVDEDNETATVRIQRCVLDKAFEETLPEWLLNGTTKPEVADSPIGDSSISHKDVAGDSEETRSELAKVLDILAKDTTTPERFTLPRVRDSTCAAPTLPAAKTTKRKPAEAKGTKSVSSTKKKGKALTTRTLVTTWDSDSDAEDGGW